MLLIDDILAAPLRGLLFVFKEIDKAVQNQREADEKSAMAELSALHRRLEAGALSESEFEAEEAKLLQRLDRLQGRDSETSDEDGHGGGSEKE